MIAQDKYNKLTCLFGHHDFGKNSVDMYGNTIRLCTVCKKVAKLVELGNNYVCLHTVAGGRHFYRDDTQLEYEKENGRGLTRIVVVDGTVAKVECYKRGEIKSVVWDYGWETHLRYWSRVNGDYTVLKSTRCVDENGDVSSRVYVPTSKSLLEG